MRKKLLTIIVSAIMVVAMAVGICGCFGNSDKGVITESEVTVFIGDTYKLTINGGGTASWESDNDAVATVDSETGVVTGVSEGTAKITATVAEGAKVKKGTCTVTVTPDTSKLFSVQTQVLNEAGDSYVTDLTASFHSTGKLKIVGIAMSLYEVEWIFDYQTTGGKLTVTPIPQYTCRNDALADTILSMFAVVDVTDVKCEMQADIMLLTLIGPDGPNDLRNVAQFNLAGYEDELGVTFGERVAVESVSLPETMTLTVGDARMFVATVLPDNATMKAVTYSSSDEGVLKVDSKGKVVALKAGTANIVATAVDNSELTATCAVTVTAAEVGTVLSVGQVNEQNNTWTTLHFAGTGNVVELVGAIEGDADKAVAINTVFTLTDNKLEAIENGMFTLSEKNYTARFTVTAGEEGAVAIGVLATNDADSTETIDLGYFVLSANDVAKLAPAKVRHDMSDWQFIVFYEDGRFAVSDSASFGFLNVFGLETTYTVTDGVLTIASASVTVVNALAPDTPINGTSSATVGEDGTITFQIVYVDASTNTEKTETLYTYKLTADDAAALGVTVVESGPVAVLTKNGNEDGSTFVVKFFADKTFTVEGTFIVFPVIINGTFGLDQTFQLALTQTGGSVNSESTEFTITVEGTTDRTITFARTSDSLTVCTITITEAELSALMPYLFG